MAERRAGQDTLEELGAESILAHCKVEGKASESSVKYSYDGTAGSKLTAGGGGAIQAGNCSQQQRVRYSFISAFHVDAVVKDGQITCQGSDARMLGFAEVGQA